MSLRKLYVIGAAMFFVASFGMAFTYRLDRPAYASSDHIVTLSGNGASPASLGIKAGESVQFNSGDDKTYSLQQGAGQAQHLDRSAKDHQHDYSGVSSGVFGAGEGYRVEFKKAGIYTFHDHTKPKLGIVVIVYDATD